MTEALASPSKKPKMTSSIMNPSILDDPKYRKDLTEAYTAAQPYPYFVMKDAFDTTLLRSVRDEIIQNVEATYKETDLFKMLQTGDLANMDKLDPENAAKLPSLFALRDAIYSPEFRKFVTDITGCGDLSDHTDCACNIHPQTGHLLCHDDVIGNRRVSFIVYLTDPDDPWAATDGGGLELYPEGPTTPNQPDVTPTATLLPIWNTMAMFMVQPGRSFHSIQEVYTGEKPRMSIQGWFHAPTAPENVELATLNQLQKAGEDDAEGNIPFSPQADTAGPISETDIALLKKYINPQYLSEDIAGKVRAKFEEDGSVQLRSFLNAEKAAEIGQACAAADSEAKLGRGSPPPSYTVGVEQGGGWEAVGPAHKNRYLRYPDNTTTSTTTSSETTTAADKAGALLHALKTDLLSTPSFARLLHKLTTLTLTTHRAEVRRFRPGLDYTVAHFGALTVDPMLDAVWCWVSDNDENDKQCWEAGDVGGFEAYLLADDAEKGQAEEVYRAGDEDSGVLNVSAAANTLNLVLRDEGLMQFVKYVSCQAPGSRWDVAAVYKPEDDSDDDDA